MTAMIVLLVFVLAGYAQPSADVTPSPEAAAMFGPVQSGLHEEGVAGPTFQRGRSPVDDGVR
jgi:hypothetical protein